MSNEYSEYDEYVAFGARGWGHAFDRYGALANAAPNMQLDSFDQNETLTFSIVTVPVDIDWSLGMYGFECEEIREVEQFEMEVSALEEIAEQAGDLDLAVDSALAEAEEVSEDD